MIGPLPCRCNGSNVTFVGFDVARRRFPGTRFVESTRLSAALRQEISGGEMNLDETGHGEEPRSQSTGDPSPSQSALVNCDVLKSSRYSDELGHMELLRTNANDGNHHIAVRSLSEQERRILSLLKRREGGERQRRERRRQERRRQEWRRQEWRR